MAAQATLKPLSKEGHYRLQNVRISYPSILKPSAVGKDGKKKYRVTALVPKDSEAAEALLAVAAETYQNAFNAKPKKKGEIRILDGDGEDFEDQEETNGHYVIRMTSERPPTAVGPNKERIDEDGKFYGGCWCHIAINAFDWNTDTGRGVSFGFNGVQFLRDDDPFGNAMNPDELFDEEDDEGDDDDGASDAASRLAGDDDEDED